MDLCNIDLNKFPPEIRKGIMRALRRKERRVKRACRRKRYFATRDVAEQCFIELRAKNQIMSSGYVYDCIYCHGCHLTNGRKYFKKPS